MVIKLATKPALVAELPSTDDKLEGVVSRALDVIAEALESPNTETRFRASQVALAAWTRLPNRVKEMAAKLDPATEEGRLLAALHNPPAQLARLLANAGYVRDQAERSAQEYSGINTVLTLKGKNNGGADGEEEK